MLANLWLDSSGGFVGVDEPRRVLKWDVMRFSRETRSAWTAVDLVSDEWGDGGDGTPPRGGEANATG